MSISVLTWYSTGIISHNITGPYINDLILSVAAIVHTAYFGSFELSRSNRNKLNIKFQATETIKTFHSTGVTSAFEKFISV